nr:cytochrome P450 [Sphingomonas sp. CDS-1]
MMDIPVLDPKDFPKVVSGNDDWRARFDALREAYPAFRVGSAPEIWFTRYEACREIFSNGELFWNGNFGDEEDRGVGTADRVTDRSTAEQGVRHHVVLRQALMNIFAPNRAKEWEATMHRFAIELIEKFADRGHCDFVHEFAHHYFPLIGCDMIGVPREDWEQMVEWEREAFKVPTDEHGMSFNNDNPAVHNIIKYTHDLLEKKRANPDDRIASWIAKQQDEGAFSADDARWAMEIIVLGSGHTVASHLTYVFRYLAERPELQSRLSEHPDDANNICEELLRVYPIGGSSRTVTADTELDGVQLKRGDKVFVNFSMPNRDPRAAGFDEINFERKTNRHLAFNQGWRQCLGLFFARRARNIAVQEWHKRIPRYSFDPSKPIVEQVYAGVGFHNLPLNWKV